MTRLALDQGWSLDLPSTFRKIENDDGTLQAVEGSRAIYFSSLSIRSRSPGISPPTASALHALPLPTSRTYERVYELVEQGCWGRAGLAKSADRISLYASREAEGSVLSMVVTFTDERDTEWALSVWRAVKFVAP